MTKIASICAAGFLALVAFAQEVLAQGNGWSHGDVGSVGATGNATYNVGTDTYTVEGAGAGIGGTADAFQYMSRTLSGDGTVVVRVATQSNTGSGARAGLMIREGTAAGARNAFLHTTISAGLNFQVRSTANGSSAVTNVSGSAPKWLKLVREGTLISGFQSADGISWTLIDTVNLPLPYEVSVGVAVTSGNDPTLGAATFDHLQLTEVAGPAGLSGFYFHGSDLSTLRVIRRDGGVRFDWAGLTPDAAVETGDYSIRWKGEVLPAFSETYTFYTLADDKVRLWVDDQLIIDHWTSHSLSEDSGSIALTQGIYYRLKMEYSKTTGSGVAVVSWSSPSLTKEVIPYLSLRNQDLDDDGMPDTWELAYGFDPGDPSDGGGDQDGDGVSNLQEYLNASDPSDYYNGVLPTLEITSGDNQSGLINTLLAQPLTVRVKKNGSPLSNAPVSFAINNGGGSLADSGGGGVAAPATVRTDSQGYAAIHFRGAASPGESIVDARAISGTSAVLVQLSARTLMAGQLPLPLSGLRVWLKGNVGVIADSNSKVSQWSDFSGDSYGASQTASGAQPQLVANAINGYPVVRFNGSSQFLSLPNAMSGATAGDMFVVLKATQDTPTSPNGFMRMGTHAYGANYPWTNQIIYDDFGSTNYHTVGNPLQPLDQYHLYNATSEGGKWTARINGKVELVDSANTVAFHASPLLGKRNYGECWAGDYAEILIFDRVLTVAERLATQTYLNQKYSVVAAPATPSGLQARMISSSQIDLIWSPMSGATEFLIERKADDETTFSIVGVAAGTVNAFVDSGLITGKSYTYRVIASASGAVSASSAEVTLATAGGAPALAITGLRIWLRADSGVLADGSGYVSRWGDHTISGNDAAQTTNSARPQLVANAINGYPVVRFNGSSHFLSLPNAMSGAAAGDMFVVLKATQDTPTSPNGFMRMGTHGYGSNYPWTDQIIYDDFGSANYHTVGNPSQPLDQYHLYNATSESGKWTARINGMVELVDAANTVVFHASPLLGKRNYGECWAGDFAEILIYDHALTDAERRATQAYLNTKFSMVAAPSTPSGLQATQVSSSQIDLVWSPMSGATEFLIERKADAETTFSTVGVVPGTLNAFLDGGLTAGKGYTYRVVASALGANSASSVEVTLATTSGTPALATTGLRLWLRADSGILADGNGYVSRWRNHSILTADASQSVSGARPQIVANAINGHPVVRFDGSVGQFFDLPNVMSGATAGEVIVVLKSAVTPAGGKGLWQFGNYYNVGAGHPGADGKVYDDFGSSTGYFEVSPWPHDVAQFHLYDVSSQAGLWQNWIDGGQLVRSTSNTVSFITNPLLGKTRGYQGAYLYSGDIAEVIVYDRVLSSAERMRVEDYLGRKYLLPSMDADEDGLTNSEEQTLGSNPLNPDTNGDGLFDGASVGVGIDPLDSDSDDDGLTNAQELALGTSPFEADTDRDGVADNLDYYPLDPTRNQAPASIPGAPVITLTTPAGLTLQP